MSMDCCGKGATIKPVNVTCKLATMSGWVRPAGVAQAPAGKKELKESSWLLHHNTIIPLVTVENIKRTCCGVSANTAKEKARSSLRIRLQTAVELVQGEISEAIRSGRRRRKRKHCGAGATEITGEHKTWKH